MTPRVHACPRCGAPAGSGATGRVQCKFCGSEIDLGDDDWVRHYQPAPTPADREAPPDLPRPPPAPSPFWGRLKVASGPLLGVAAGYLAVQSILVFIGNGAPRPIPISVLMGVVVISLAVSGRKIQGLLAAALAGLLFAAKPITRPVFMKDGHVFGLTSETHLNYLVPGVLFLVAATIIAMTLKKEDRPGKPSAVLAVLGAVGFAAGIALAAPGLVGESINEAILRYRPRFEAMRGTWRTIDAKLPPPGSVVRDKVRRDLQPQPVVSKKNRARNNTEIVSAEALADPDAKVSYELFVSGDLHTGMLWTGPKNPMSESVLYDSAGDFVKKLDAALGYRYLVVYRPATAERAPVESASAAGGIDVFVFDLTTTELVASFHGEKAGSFTEGREALARGLERATGGLFDFD